MAVAAAAPADQVTANSTIIANQVIKTSNMQIQFLIRATKSISVSCMGCLLLMMSLGCQNGPLQNQDSSGFGFPPLPSSVTQPPSTTTHSSSGSASKEDKVDENKDVSRGQSPDNKFWYGNSNAQSTNSPQPQAANQASAIGTTGNQQGFANSYTPGSTGRKAQQATYQFPELAPNRGIPANRGILPGNGLNSPNIGDPNQLNPIVQPFERGGNASVPFGNNPNANFPTIDYADLDVTVAQTNTGRINIGGAFNSDNGIVGQFIIDEKDFDITRFPRNFQDILDGNAFRGGGQAFRLEIVPGQDLERYLASFTEPYFLGTDYSFSASGYLFDRSFFDWDENRVGGRISFGRRLTPDLSISAGLRLERVEVDNPREEVRVDGNPLVSTSDQLNEVLGEKQSLFLANIGLVRDTRDHPFLATKGTYFSGTFSQAFGDFDYSRIDLEYRRHRLIYERPDRSGRHTISYGTKLGYTGSGTPVYEHYFAGGFSTFRGFDFRGVGPKEGATATDEGVRIGGEFQWLNTVEYTFPLTADDMVKGVLFCDFGTVEQDVGLDQFRVAPGFGFRVNVPAIGIGAPLAFDFAFPVSSEDEDDEQTFSFYLGVLR